jgi:hypothetical protein
MSHPNAIFRPEEIFGTVRTLFGHRLPLVPTIADSLISMDFS